MPNKTYKSLTGIRYTFPVKVKEKDKEKVHWVSFSGDQGDFSTSNKDVQSAIENCQYFLDKKIGFDSVKEEGDGVVEIKSIDPKEFPEVTDMNGAVAILRGEPYKVHHLRLSNKEAVLRVAGELGVTFPNLKFD